MYGCSPQIGSSAMPFAAPALFAAAAMLLLIGDGGNIIMLDLLGIGGGGPAVLVADAVLDPNLYNLMLTYPFLDRVHAHWAMFVHQTWNQNPHIQRLILRTRRIERESRVGTGRDIPNGIPIPKMGNPDPEA